MSWLLINHPCTIYIISYRFLESQLDPSNCLGLGSFLCELGLMDFKKKVEKYVCDNFEEVGFLYSWYFIAHMNRTAFFLPNSQKPLPQPLKKYKMILWSVVSGRFQPTGWILFIIVCFPLCIYVPRCDA